MRKFEIENAIKPMIGDLFTYNKAVHCLLRYDLNDTRLRITTDIQDIVILNEDAEDVLARFTIVEEVELPKTPAISPPAAQSKNAIVLSNLIKQTTIGSMAQELKQEVMDAIKKVKEDKNYIGQASAINDGIKQVLDIAKAEIEMFKVMDSINRS